jgi:hypothetical protein
MFDLLDLVSSRGFRRGNAPGSKSRHLAALKSGRVQAELEAGLKCAAGETKTT